MHLRAFQLVAACRPSKEAAADHPRKYVCALQALARCVRATRGREVPQALVRVAQRSVNLRCDLLCIVPALYRSCGARTLPPCTPRSPAHPATQSRATLGQKRLTMSLETRDRFGEATACGDLGNALACSGQYAEAIAFYERQLAIAGNEGH